MSMPRKDWTPQNRAELCACIAWMFREGKLSPADWDHVAGYVTFCTRPSPGEPGLSA